MNRNRNREKWRRKQRRGQRDPGAGSCCRRLELKRGKWPVSNTWLGSGWGDSWEEEYLSLYFEVFLFLWTKCHLFPEVFSKNVLPHNQCFVSAGFGESRRRPGLHGWIGEDGGCGDMQQQEIVRRIQLQQELMAAKELMAKETVKIALGSQRALEGVILCKRGDRRPMTVLY